MRAAAAPARLGLILIAGLAGCVGNRPWDPLPPAYRFERFEAADLDRDGKLDRAETGSAFPEFLERFNRLDTDKSGLLSWSEFRSYARIRGHVRELPPDPPATRPAS